MNPCPKGIRTRFAIGFLMKSSICSSAKGRRRASIPIKFASPARPSPRPTGSSSPARSAGRKFRTTRSMRPFARRSRTSATSRTAFTGATPRSKCCCTPSPPTSPRASTRPATRTRAQATRASCSATPAAKRRNSCRRRSITLTRSCARSRRRAIPAPKRRWDPTPRARSLYGTITASRSRRRRSLSRISTSSNR